MIYILIKSLVLLKQASWDSFDNDYSWLHIYIQERADFPNFNVHDLFILSKIERLYETKLISKDIRDTLCDMGYFDIPILYGASVNANNAGEIMSIPNVDGVLVGGASLKIDDFIPIIKSVK